MVTIIFHLTESLSLGADNLSVPIPYHLLVLLQNGDDVNKNSFALLMHMLIDWKICCVDILP